MTFRSPMTFRKSGSARAALCGMLAVSALAVAGCDVQVGDKGVSFDIASGRASEQWDRTYRLEKGGHFEIANLNGTIKVAASTGDTVEVHATREAKAGSDEDARTLLASAAMVEQVSPGHVSIDVQHPAGGFGRGRSLTIQYDVRVPPGLNVSFHTQNGNVQLESVRGTITAGTTNGGVNGTNLSGAITADTINGGVQLALADVTGGVQARTVNGGIRIGLPPGAGAQLDANVVNGGVSVDDALALTGAQRDPRHVSGVLQNGGPTISAQTTNGGVRIYATGREAAAQRGR
jgi:hypothetical protein